MSKAPSCVIQSPRTGNRFGATRTGAGVDLFEQTITKGGKSLRWKKVGSSLWDERFGMYGGGQPLGFDEVREQLDACLRAPGLATLFASDGTAFAPVPGTPFVEDPDGERYTRAFIEARYGPLK